MRYWDVLGLAPTQDLVAIKKAYALKLRVTRPDDDAAAYQQLRDAYERAQQWARWAGDEEDEEDESELEPPTVEVVETPAVALMEPAVEPAEEGAEETAEETAEAGIGSEDLAGWVQSLRSKAPDEVTAAWAQVQASLHAIPLHLQAEASARFADLVIGEPLLPVAILGGLQHHFGWREDFRVARQLGGQRTRALHEVLDERIARAITDPEQLQRFAPFLHLQHLRRQSRDMAAFWFALRMGDPLLQLAISPEARKPRVVEGDREAPISSGWLVFWAGVARGVPLALLLPLWLKPEETFNFLRQAAPKIPEDLILLALLKILLIGAVPVALSLLGMGLMWLVLIAAHGIGFAAWRALGYFMLGDRWREMHSHPKRARWGLALLACSAVWMSMEGFGIGPLYMLALPFWVVGALMAWPREAKQGAVALGALLLTGQLALAAAARDQDWNAALLFLPLWVLGGCRLYALRKEVPVFSWFFRPITNSLHLCDRYGYKFALTPALIAGFAIVSNKGEHGSVIFMYWVLSILALAWVQNGLTRSAMGEIT